MATEEEVQAEGATKNAKPKKKITDYLPWWENPTDRFAFFLVIVTFLLVLATVGLWIATRDLVNDARETAQRQLRAYLYVFPVTLAVIAPEKMPMVLLSMKNHGTTPLRNGHVRFGFDYALRRPENDYTVSENTMIVSKPAVALAGGGESSPLRLSWKEPTTQEAFLRVRDQNYVVIVKGTFTYEDIFRI